MKRIASFLIGVAFCVSSAIAQDAATTPTATVSSSQWNRFNQLCEKKLYPQAIRVGVKTSVNYTDNRLYKEAFATCRQMDALINTCEQEGGSVRYDLRYPVAKERLRLWTNLKNIEQCRGLLASSTRMSTN